jgi:deoxyribodipyrimidine photo-lyase
MNIFLFTRDLRIPDNTGLLECLRDSTRPLLCVFCFDPAQVGGDDRNPYRSDNAIDFMIESLEDLESEFKETFPGSGSGSRLRFLSGNKAECIESVIKYANKDSGSGGGVVHMSAGFTPFEVKTESSLREVCKKYPGWSLQTHEDFLLWDGARDTTPSSGKMFTRYTPFMRTAFQHSKEWRKPADIPRGIASRITFAFPRVKLPGESSLKDIREKLTQGGGRRVSPARIVRGGRRSALERIAYLKREHRLDRYTQTRNDLAGETSLLSAYHKFGCVSPRETHHFFGGKKYKGFTQELLWRDYAYHRIANWNQEDSITEIGKHIQWSNPVPGSGSALFKAWKEGTTGVPIVDAGMRQLLQEGYIHNRARMVVAQYLIKVLQVDWRLGEKHFAQWLTDYDWSVNFMNWILISAIMPTEQVSRYMNPYIQMRKFDPDLVYVQKYIPELASFRGTHQELRKLLLDDSRTTDIKLSGKPPYPKPIVPFQSAIKSYRKWAGGYLKRTRKQSFKKTDKTDKKTRKKVSMKIFPF